MSCERTATRQGSKSSARSSRSNSGTAIGLSSLYHCQYCSGVENSPARSMYRGGLPNTIARTSSGEYLRWKCDSAQNSPR